MAILKNTKNQPPVKMTQGSSSAAMAKKLSARDQEKMAEAKRQRSVMTENQVKKASNGSYSKSTSMSEAKALAEKAKPKAKLLTSSRR
jgi:hypothetical protein